MDKQSPMFAVNNNFVCFTRENDGSEKNSRKGKKRKEEKNQQRQDGEKCFVMTCWVREII